MWTKIETNTYVSLTLTWMKSLLRVLILMNCRVFIVQDLALIDLIDGRARCTCSADWQRVNEWKDAKRCALCKQVFVVTELLILFNIVFRGVCLSTRRGGVSSIPPSGGRRSPPAGIPHFGGRPPGKKMGPDMKWHHTPPAPPGTTHFGAHPTGMLPCECFRCKACSS